MPVLVRGVTGGAHKTGELSRKDLRELRLALDQRGTSETTLVTAWRETTNQEMAASIMGWVRQAALGDPLMLYEQRVDKALQRIANQAKAITIEPSTTTPCCSAAKAAAGRG